MVSYAGGKRLPSLPFPAIVGQAELKRVLLAVAIHDGLDGALITGEKGTAKSTAVRALVDLLPEQRVVADCQYGCAPADPAFQCADCRDRDPEDVPVETRSVPLVTLPLGATRDRVVGTLSVADALAGEAEFDPGLLARAHRGILYVDEVNLLDDHLVDVVLDAAASGVNTVERDGVSVSHPADFTLIGTMNPEEGDLRPQLRDRFALQATVSGCREIDDRVEIIDRALGADDDADPHVAYAADVERLCEEVATARKLVPDVGLPTEFKETIAQLCLDAGVDGHRGDVATARTAIALAALDGRPTVIEPDIHEAASYALAHRLQSTPFEETPDLDDLLEDRFDEPDRNENGDTDDSGGEAAEGDSTDGEGETDGTDEDTADGRPDEPTGDSESDDTDHEADARDRDGTESDDRTGEAGEEREENDGRDGSADGDTDSEDETATPIVPGQQRAEIGEAQAPTVETPDVSGDRGGSGSRAQSTPSVDNRGARVRTEPATGDGPIDAAASVRSAASRGETRVGRDDLRQSVRAGESSVTIVFAVDASASMRPAMRAAKGVVLDLLRESYERRDQVAFVAFAGEGADVLLPPTDSVTLAARHLKDLPSGDRTPLPAGLETSRQVIDRTETDGSVVVVVTDGRANVADGSPTEATRRAARGLAGPDTHVVVVDAGDDSRAGLSELIVTETGGELVSLSALSTETIRVAAEHAASDRGP